MISGETSTLDCANVVAGGAPFAGADGYTLSDDGDSLTILSTNTGTTIPFVFTRSN